LRLLGRAGVGEGVHGGALHELGAQLHELGLRHQVVAPLGGLGQLRGGAVQLGPPGREGRALEDLPELA